MMGRTTKSMADSTSRNLGYQTRGRTRQAQQQMPKKPESDEDPEWTGSELEEDEEDVDMEEEWTPSRHPLPKTMQRRGLDPDDHRRTDPCSEVPAGHSEDKLLMRPWLITQVQRGHIPGLQWMNKEKTLLRIPWMHGSSQKWKVNHSELFKSWAKHSGKSCLAAEEASDPKRWKANFRCALNSLPDVKEDKSLSQRKGQDAFKVYKFLPPKQRRSEIRKHERTQKHSVKLMGQRVTKADRKRLNTRKFVPTLDVTKKQPDYTHQQAQCRLPDTPPQEPFLRDPFHHRHYELNIDLESICPPRDIPCGQGRPVGRILPSPVTDSMCPTVAREETVHTDGIVNFDPREAPPSPRDHSYALCDQLNPPTSGPAIPTVVENMSQQPEYPAAQIKHEVGPVTPFWRTGGTALERVCAQYQLPLQRPQTIMPNTMTTCSPHGSTGDDSAFSEISGSSSPMTDITDEDLDEVGRMISDMEPMSLLNQITTAANTLTQYTDPVSSSAMYQEYGAMMEGFRPTQPTPVQGNYDVNSINGGHHLSTLKTVAPPIMP